MTELEKVELALNELGSTVAETSGTLAVLDAQLAPYWYERGEIEHDIRMTHGRRADGAVMFNPDATASRVPLFAMMDELAAEWGPLKTERAALKTRLSGYEREQRTLVNELKRLRRKADKAGVRADTGQGGLFD